MAQVLNRLCKGVASFAHTRRAGLAQRLRCISSTLPVKHGERKDLEGAKRIMLHWEGKKEEPIDVDGIVGESLLEAAHRHNVDLEGACEGVCACSTCHVILEPHVYDTLPDPSEEEEDMLDQAWGLTPTSRLGCQVVVTEDMDGMKIKLPAATRNFYVDLHSGVYSFVLPAPSSKACLPKGRNVVAAVEGTLYDFPVSNNGGRVRALVYDKGIQDKIRITKPEDVTALNPQAKVPVFMDESGLRLAESDTILRYLADKYSDVGPSYRPSSLEARTKSDLICRFHDVYITPIQGCMYKASPPFGQFSDRQEALNELKRQMGILEDLADQTGPYLTGSEKSMADATLFATGVFLEQILPNHFGWTYQEVFGPKLTKWWDFMLAKEPAYKKVHSEIINGLQQWEERRRWSTILGADLQDLAPATVFDKILKKEVPADVVYEDDKVLAFRDISPQAPTHIVLIPKRRQGLTQLRKATDEQKGILGHLLVAAGKIAMQEKLGDGYRVVINDGPWAGQGKRLSRRSA